MSLAVLHGIVVGSLVTSILSSAPDGISPPSNVQATPSTICVGQSLTLSGIVGPGETIDWYTGSCGGTFVTTGVSVEISPGASATYFARSRDLKTDRMSATCGSVATTVAPAPVAPTTASASPFGCAGANQVVLLSASGGSGTTLQWFANDCSGTPVKTGNGVTVNISEPTVFYARWITACAASACTASALVNYVEPVAPTSISTDPGTTIAFGDSVTLTAVGGSGVTLRWYEQEFSSDTCTPWPLCASFAGGVSTVVAPTQTTKYYASWLGTCGSSNYSSFTSITIHVVACLGDFDESGIVDGSDLGDLLGEWGDCPAEGYCFADFNGDGVVDGNDLGTLLGAWGPCPAN